MALKSNICRLLYELFAKHLPSSNYFINIGQKKIRYILIRGFVDECGKNVNIENNAKISKKCIIGNNSGIGIRANIGSGVSIGDDVMMGPDCLILTRNHKFDDTRIPIRQQGFTEEKPVIIGNDVWIGSRVIILGGVTIGNHCVIGAGSVVTHDVNDYEVVAGNPARVIKIRKKVGVKDDTK